MKAILYHPELKANTCCAAVVVLGASCPAYHLQHSGSVVGLVALDDRWCVLVLEDMLPGGNTHHMQTVPGPGDTAS